MNEQKACVSIQGCGIEMGPFWVGTLGKKKNLQKRGAYGQKQMYILYCKEQLIH